MVRQAVAALPDLERIISGGQLPALPQSAIRLLELSRDPANGPAEFAVPIEADPGLTGQVLRFVNSSYFGFSREISSVKLAITLVGIHTIKNFTLWSAIFSLMPNPKCGPFDLKLLWQDSLRRALFARDVAKAMGIKDGDEAFAAALLQDMAVPLLAREYPSEYSQFLESRADGAVRLSELERGHFGWSHADVAARLARHWALPEELAAPIERHTAADEVFATGEASPIERCVSLSALLPASADSGWAERNQFETYFERVRGAALPAPEELLGHIDAAFVEFAPVLQLSRPAQTLVQCYQAAIAAAN